MTSARRHRLALAAAVVVAVVGGGTVVAGAATPAPLRPVDQTGPPPGADASDEADEDEDGARPADDAARQARSAARQADGTARQAGRPADGAGPPAVATGPAFVCDPALTHGQNVSAYARSLPKGPGRGRLVSQAARSDCGRPSAGD